MNLRHVLFIIVLALAGGLHAQSFEEANDLYSNGQYSEAATIYQAIIDNNDPAQKSMAAVYYNLGNAYFKMGELSQSILAYERCLRINPNHRDAQYNLQFAESRITDNIIDNRTFFLSNLLARVRNQLREPAWMWMSIISFTLTLVLLLIFLLSAHSGIRKAAFYIGLCCLVISICALANSSSLHQRDTERAEAIITQGIVNAKAAPDRSGTELFTLHEGTKVYIEETIGEWCNIRVGNNEGWIPARTLERI